MRVWRGRDSGPYMHSIHFSFAVGAFIAPLVAAPFLSERATSADNFALINGTDFIDLDKETRITTLYPLMGSIPTLVSFGYLYFHFSTLKTPIKFNKSETDDGEKTIWTRSFSNKSH